MKKKLSKPLTWDELATDYDKYHNGRPARTLSMDTVFDWAESKTDLFKIMGDGTICKILKSKNHGKVF